ncbi:putative membrane protein [Clostridium saccharobutylicum]|nr:putative membrane protein [Clostridium saccharobutylicum]
MKLYFDNAVMSNENAVVRINASFSGIELYIPKAWNVDDKTNVFLGSVSEKNRNNQVTTNTLTLVGDVSFSGVEIIYI